MPRGARDDTGARGCYVPRRQPRQPEVSVTSYQDHHLTPPIAAALERLGWSPDDSALRETAPTAARGHNLVVVAPPSPAYAVPALAGMLSRLGPDARGLLLCSEAQLSEWGALATSLGGDALRIQVARGTARATRRLKAAEVDLVVTSPDTALALHRRSALGPEAVGAVFLAWPESWESGDSLAPLMQDLEQGRAAHHLHRRRRPRGRSGRALRPARPHGRSACPRHRANGSGRVGSNGGSILGSPRSVAGRAGGGLGSGLGGGLDGGPRAPRATSPGRCAGGTRR